MQIDKVMVGTVSRQDVVETLSGRVHWGLRSGR
jgi:hypothetical protein